MKLFNRYHMARVISLSVVLFTFSMFGSAVALGQGFTGRLPTSDALQASFIRATDAINNESWEQAIGELQSIIEAESDAYPDTTSAVGFNSIQLERNDDTQPTWKGIAAKTLSQLPPAGIEAYRTRYEPIASARLLAAGDRFSRRADIALTFRWTPTAQRELLRLAALATDAGNHVDALRLLVSIPALGDAELAATITARTEIVLKSLAPGQARQTAQWLRPGCTSQGNACAVDAPLSSDGAWVQPIVEDFDAAESVESFAEALSQAATAIADTGTALRPVRVAIEPIIIDDTVIFAGLGRVRAYDVSTGKLKWRSALPDQALHYLSNRVLGREDITGAKRVLWMLERLAVDRTQGSLSSNGEVVFAVVDGGSDMLADIDSPESAKHPLARSLSNRLVAFDAGSGLIRWWNGGPKTGAVPAPLAGVFFFGPPACGPDSAFVIGQEGGQVRMYELDYTTGEVISSQDLWNSLFAGEASVLQATSGTTPFLSGSVAICRLDEVLLAIDVASDEVLWSSARRGPDFVDRSQLNRESDTGGPVGTLMRRARLHYPTTLIHGMTVIDLDGEFVTALDLLTGELRWRIPRSDTTWIDCVTDDTLVVVNQRGMAGIDAESGVVLWQRSLPPVSGGGLPHDGLITVPLQTGEIATLEAKSGRLIARTPVRSGTALGTLVAVDGTTVSFNGRDLIGFAPVDIGPIEQSPDLAALPADDRTLWMERAAELLHRRQGPTALAILEGLHRGNPDDAGLETMLASSLLIAADSQPEKVLEVAERLRIDALPGPTALALRRFLIEQYRTAANAEREVDQLIRLIALGLTADVVNVDENRHLSTQQAAIARLTDILEELPTEEVATLQQQSTRTISELPRVQLGNLAGRIPHALLTSQTAVEVAVWATPPSRRENLLWQTLDHGPQLTPADRVKAFAALAEIYATAGRAFDLSALEQELAGVAERTAFDEVVGKESVQRLLRVTRPWQAGPLDVRERAVVSDGSGMADLLHFAGPRTSQTLVHWLAGPQHRDFTLLDPRGQTTESFDLDGRVPYADRVNYVETYGHMAVLARYGRFEILDLLDHPVRTLASFSTTSSSNWLSASGGRRAAGLKTLIGTDRFEQPIGTVGPLTPQSVAYIQGETLTAVDLYRPTGPPLWTVTGVPAGSELFGDDDILIARVPGKRTLLAFRQLDGRPVEIAELPANFWGSDLPDIEWLPGRSLVGRNILRLEKSAEKQTLQLFDAVEASPLWSVDLPPESVLLREGDVILAAGKSGGPIQLIDATSGETVGRAELPQLEEPQYTLHRDGKLTFVICGTPPTENVKDIGPSERHARPITATDVLANGPVIAFGPDSSVPLWVRNVNDQQFAFAQPSSWPFLLFASNYVYPESAESSKIMSNLRLELVDKQSGETLWQKHDLPYSRAIEWQPRRAGLPGTTIRLNAVSLDIRPVEADEDSVVPQGNSEPPVQDSESETKPEPEQ